MRGAGSSFIVLAFYTLCFSGGVFGKHSSEKRPVHAKRSSRYLKARWECAERTVWVCCLQARFNRCKSGVKTRVISCREFPVASQTCDNSIQGRSGATTDLGAWNWTNAIVVTFICPHGPHL